MNWKKALGKKLKKKGGFTLIEMLIVVAIIAILVAVSIPMVGASLDKARTATDDANERAAKTAALLAFMNETTAPTTDTVYCYDAEAGQAKKQTGAACVVSASYGQGSKDDANQERKGHIDVTVTKDGVASVEWSGG